MKLSELKVGAPFRWNGRTFYRGFSDTQTISVYEVVNKHLVFPERRLPEHTIVEPIL